MSRQTPSLSFEVFPPNPAVGNDNIISTFKLSSDKPATKLFAGLL